MTFHTSWPAPYCISCMNEHTEQHILAGKTEILIIVISKQHVVITGPERSK